MLRDLRNAHRADRVHVQNLSETLFGTNDRTARRFSTPRLGEKIVERVVSTLAHEDLDIAMVSHHVEMPTCVLEIEREMPHSHTSAFNDGCHVDCFPVLFYGREGCSGRETEAERTVGNSLADFPSAMIRRAVASAHDDSSCSGSSGNAMGIRAWRNWGWSHVNIVGAADRVSQLSCVGDVSHAAFPSLLVLSQ